MAFSANNQYSMAHRHYRTNVPCKYFPFGRCFEGANCRYSHNIPSTPMPQSSAGNYGPQYGPQCSSSNNLTDGMPVNSYKKQHTPYAQIIQSPSYRSPIRQGMTVPANTGFHTSQQRSIPAESSFNANYQLTGSLPPAAPRAMREKVQCFQTLAQFHTLCTNNQTRWNRKHIQRRPIYQPDYNYDSFGAFEKDNENCDPSSTDATILVDVSALSQISKPKEDRVSETKSPTPPNDASDVTPLNYKASPGVPESTVLRPNLLSKLEALRAKIIETQEKRKIQKASEARKPLLPCCKLSESPRRTNLGQEEPAVFENPSTSPKAATIEAPTSCLPNLELMARQTIESHQALPETFTNELITTASPLQVQYDEKVVKDVPLINTSPLTSISGSPVLKGSQKWKANSEGDSLEQEIPRPSKRRGSTDGKTSHTAIASPNVSPPNPILSLPVWKTSQKYKKVSEEENLEKEIFTPFKSSDITTSNPAPNSPMSIDSSTSTPQSSKRKSDSEDNSSDRETMYPFKRRRSSDIDTSKAASSSPVSVSGSESTDQSLYSIYTVPSSGLETLPSPIIFPRISVEAGQAAMMAEMRLGVQADDTETPIENVLSAPGPVEMDPIDNGFADTFESFPDPGWLPRKIGYYDDECVNFGNDDDWDPVGETTKIQPIATALT